MTFTEQDAAILIEHAQSAPLVNLRHAEQISQLLQRFAKWHKQVTCPPDHIELSHPEPAVVSFAKLGAAE